MKTENTEQDVRNLRGWVFYDASCSLCNRGAARVSGLFIRRGFLWRPLQTPGAAAMLGLGDTAMREEMKLLLADGRVVGGVDAWCVLFRSVWWLRPLGAVLEWPGVHALAAVCYRWVARHRYCLNGRCRVHGIERAHHRHAAFFELP